MQNLEVLNPLAFIYLVKIYNNNLHKYVSQSILCGRSYIPSKNHSLLLNNLSAPTLLTELSNFHFPKYNNTQDFTL